MPPAEQVEATRQDNPLSKPGLRLLILIVIAAVVYQNSLPNGFTMDDGLYITNNSQITQPSLGTLFAPHKASNAFRPLTFITFALNWAADPGPLGFHVVSLLLHAAVTSLLYLLLRELFESLQGGESLAFAAAILFAVHPIHTEAVASIVGRAELLAAGFIFAAWLFHLCDREILAIICFVLALFSKESAVAFLPLVLTGDYVRAHWKPLSRYLRLAGVTLLYVDLLWTVQGRRFGQAGISPLDNPLAQLPAGWRILNALRVAWKYIALQFYPARLSADYSFNEIAIYRDWMHTLPAAFAALAVVIAWIWAIRSQRREWALAGGIYFAGFATTANILLPTGTIMGERLAYLPSAGFCLLLALGWLWLKNRQETVATGIIVIAVAALGIRTIARNSDWQNDFTLFSAAAQSAPGSAKAHTRLGDLYMAQQQLDLAESELQAALRIYPGLPDALADYGLLEFRRGNLQSAGRMMETALNTSTRDNPNYDFMAVNFAAILMQTGHADAALDLLNREIDESPSYARAWSNRALIRYQRGETNSALTDARTALRLDPSNAEAGNLMLQFNPPTVASSPARATPPITRASQTGPAK